MGALDGLRILDLTTGIAGPIGVLLLAEQGADVIKVEPPGGHPFRDQPEYRVWDRSRRSVELDLKSDEGVAAFLGLVGTADVLVESFRPGAMAALGLDHASLRERFPRLVYCSIPGWPTASRRGSRPGWDALVQAGSGLQWEQPGWRLGPTFLQNPLPSMAAAHLAPMGILAALSAREETGRGQHVEASLYQGALSLTTMLWIHGEKGQSDISSNMSKTYPPGVHQSSIFETADGWIHASARGSAGGRSPGEILGLPEGVDQRMILPLRMQGTPESVAQADAIQQQVVAAYRKHPTSFLVEAFHENGLEAEDVRPAGGYLEHEQLLATGGVADVVDPEIGATRQIGITIGLSETPGEVKGPRPLLGQHTDEVLAEVAAAGAVSQQAGTGALDHALGDITVLDFGRAFAGPFAAMVMASLGARVIRVGSVGPGFAMGGGPELGCQQGKESISVDMKTPEGREILARLVANADVVHHNMTKGVAERLGIDQESLAKIKPDIITCNTFMYGPYGPLSGLGGIDPLAQAAAGLEFEAGPVAHGNPPLWYRFGHGDTANALSSIVGVLAALVHKKRTGKGQAVWTSLLHATAMMGSGTYLTESGMSDSPTLDKDQAGLGALYRLYETQGGWLQLAAVRPEQWDGLCAALGLADLAHDERFVDAEARNKNRTELEDLLKPVFATRTALNWRRRLESHGVPSEIAVDTLDGELALFDQENLDLGLVVEYEHHAHGTLRQVGKLVTFSETPGRVERPPVPVGTDTQAILRELGYDDAGIVDLRARGIIEWPEAVEA